MICGQLRSNKGLVRKRIKEGKIKTNYLVRLTYYCRFHYPGYKFYNLTRVNIVCHRLSFYSLIFFPDLVIW